MTEYVVYVANTPNALRNLRIGLEAQTWGLDDPPGNVVDGTSAGGSTFKLETVPPSPATVPGVRFQHPLSPIP